jgi:hypothetical protein
VLTVRVGVVLMQLLVESHPVVVMMVVAPILRLMSLARACYQLPSLRLVGPAAAAAVDLNQQVPGSWWVRLRRRPPSMQHSCHAGAEVLPAHLALAGPHHYHGPFQQTCVCHLHCLLPGPVYSEHGGMYCWSKYGLDPHLYLMYYCQRPCPVGHPPPHVPPPA